MKNKDLSRFEKILRLVNRDNIVHLNNVTSVKIKKEKNGASILLEDEMMNKREYFEISRARYEEVFDLVWEEQEK